MERVDFDQDSTEFLSWLKKQPRARVSSKIEIADLRNRGAGRGIIANRDIDESEEICSVPFETVLSTSTSELQQLVSEDLKSLEPWLSLTFVLFHESSKGQNSGWWPYLRLLPRHFNTLIYWSKSEITELQGSAAVDKIGKETADKTFVEVLMPLAIKYAEVFGDYSTWLRESNVQDHFLPIAHRMASLVMAYAFDLEKEELVENADADGFLSNDEDDPMKGMVPLADMFNADDAEKNNARLFHGHTCLNMVAVKFIKEGEEIFNDYGPLPRSDLLRRYGYVIDSYKKWDVVEIDTMSILEIARMTNHFEDAEIDQRTRLAQRWETWEESFDLTRQGGDETLAYYGFEPSFLLTLAVFATKRADLQGLIDAKKAPEPKIDLTVASLLREVLKYRQKEYSTSITDDVMFLQDAATHGRRRIAIDIRLGEKEILASTLQFVEKKIETEAVIASSQKSTSSSNSHRVKRRKTKG